MRKVQKLQMELGEIDPRFVFIDPKNRDELTDTLIGIQHVYRDDELRQAVFSKLESLIPEYRKGKSGRPGLSMWETLVLAVVGLSCNFDYDMLKNRDNHKFAISFDFSSSVPTAKAVAGSCLNETPSGASRELTGDKQTYGSDKTW